MTSPRSIDSFATMTPESCPNKSAIAVLNANKFTPSTESFFSGPSSFSSASVLYGTKVNKNMKKRHRLSSYIPATNDVRQRVLSARHLRLKNVQNQLGLAQHRIAELSDELRALRTMHKRQNSALAKYEATNAELPRLLNAHAEELRVWQTKYRTLKAAHRELNQKLKHKETIIQNLAEENKYFNQLNKDKNLAERQHLADKLDILQNRLHDRENQMKMVERRAHLEIKGLKQQLQSEQKKLKEVMQKLEKARIEMSSYRKLDELKITDKMSQLNLKSSSNPKHELKITNLKKVSKEKLTDIARVNSSKTPSPVMPSTNGNVNDEEDSDFPTSHRSQRSTSSSNNMVFTTQRSVRKNSSSSRSKKYGSETAIAALNSGKGEIIGDGPHVVKKIETLAVRKQISSTTKQIKMMVNMPSFDAGACGDGIWATNDEDDEAHDEAALQEEAAAARQSTNGGACNYSDDFDENVDEDELEVIIKETDINYEADVKMTNDGRERNNEAEINTSRSSTSKDILNIRKQITEDYKQREAFLDTFCRQATSSSGQRQSDEASVGASGDSNPNPNYNAARKKQLLDALKAIDDDKRCNQDSSVY